MSRCVATFNLKTTVKHKYIYCIIKIDNQQDATILIYLLLISSTYFGRCFCNGVSYWVEQVPPNTKHQPAATSVENTTSCSYSDLLLMMGENFARNM